MQASSSNGHPCRGKFWISLVNGFRHLLAIAWIVGFSGCRPQSSEVVPEAAASQPANAREVYVLEDAQQAIGLTTTKVRKREVRQSIPATGWLVAKPASEIVVKAPTAGFVSLNSENGAELGDLVEKHQRIGTLVVFLSPQEQAQLVIEKENADTLIAQSQTTAKLAEEQLKRIEEHSGNVVAGIRLNELRETIANARAAEQAARDKLPFMPQEPYDEGVGLTAVSVEAPLGGRLVNIHFAPRQFVVQGDPLWTIADWSKLWIQVPVYAGSLSRVAKEESAIVRVPDAGEIFEAKPVQLIQPTEPGKQTVELLYEIDNSAEAFRPGQTLAVSLPIGKQVTETVIPRSAILWDGMGNSWVFVKSSPTAFHRERIELGQLVGSDAVVRRGVTAGEEIVTTGAESLYGEEFQGQLRAEDD